MTIGDMIIIQSKNTGEALCRNVKKRLLEISELMRSVNRLLVNWAQLLGRNVYNIQFMLISSAFVQCEFHECL